MIMSEEFAWRKQLQCNLEWHVISCWQLTDEVAESHLLWD